MRDKNVFGIRRCLPRMSWSPQNLYNIWRRSTPPLRDQTVFTQTNQTLFQQRWASKQLTRAYHGDFINEKIFKRWYVPATLPDVRLHKRVSHTGSSDQGLNKWAQRENAAKMEKKAREEEEQMAQAPVASLMFEEVERRMDVFIFRCCFAHSVYEARRMVIHGDVMLNGKKHQNANTRLAPGDMVSVNPSAIRFLQEPKRSPQESSETDAIKASSSKHGQTFATLPLTPFHLPAYAAPFIFIPAYIEVSFQTCSAIFVRRPTARFGYSEIPTPFEADGEIMRLSWEWYNRVRPRMRSKSQLAQMPENRKETRFIPGVGGQRETTEVEGTSLRAQLSRNSIYD